MDWHRDGRTTQRLAAGFWLAAAVLYLTSELAAAIAFTPRYSYAHNYISDLGVPVCGTVYDGRSICSPLHALMNAAFLVQGVLFISAALAISRSIPTVATVAFVAVSAVNGIGNFLLASFSENAPGHFSAALSFHVLGALLAIVFGNAAALMSASIFRHLGLPRFHRLASIGLPLAAALSFTVLIMARESRADIMVAAAVWERISVYTITAWEMLTAACLMVRTRG